MNRPEHVKASTTGVSVEKSQQDAIAILRRYGASGFGFEHGEERAAVRFRIAGHEVELPVNVARVYEAMYGGKNPAMSGNRYLDHEQQERQLARWHEQAERTAWRNLVDWLDASLSMVTLGVRSLEETFLADLIVESTDGARGRTIDYIATLRGTDGRVPGVKLLASGSSPLRRSDD